MQEVKTEQRIKAAIGIMVGVTTGIIMGVVSASIFFGIAVAVVIGLSLSALLTHQDTPIHTGTKAPNVHRA